MKKFAIRIIEKQLLQINKKNGVSTNAAVQLIVNNLQLYNDLLFRYTKQDDTSLVFILYQINGQIFKQLKEFKILPSAVKMIDDKEDGFTKMIEDVKLKKVVN